jgi:BA14K-like protein
MRIYKIIYGCVASLLLVGAASTTSALPLASNGSAINQATPEATTDVYWRGRGWGWGVGAGLIGGAIIGGALAAPYYYGGPDPYYGPGPYGPAYGPGPYGPAYGPGPYGPAYGPGPYGPAYAGPPPGDAVAYCFQRFRSYDPRSGTYLGNDGYRHPCP